MQLFQEEAAPLKAKPRHHWKPELQQGEVEVYVAVEVSNFEHPEPLKAFRSWLDCATYVWHDPRVTTVMASGYANGIKPDTKQVAVIPYPREEEIEVGVARWRKDKILRCRVFPNAIKQMKWKITQGQMKGDAVEIISAAIVEFVQ